MLNRRRRQGASHSHVQVSIEQPELDTVHWGSVILVIEVFSDQLMSDIVSRDHLETSTPLQGYKNFRSICIQQVSSAKAN